jgi:hypothetical protein
VVFVLSLGIIPWEINNQVLGWLWLLNVVMFGGLGHLLISEKQPARSTVAA